MRTVREGIEDSPRGTRFAHNGWYREGGVYILQSGVGEALLAL
jgi:hypothetical protein